MRSLNPYKTFDPSTISCLSSTAAVQDAEESRCLIDERVLRDTVRSLKRGFERGQDDRVLAYAVKANPHPRIVEAVAAAGIAAFDCASGNEVDLVLGVRPQARVLFNHPVKRARDIAAAAAAGVRHFTAQSAREVDKIAAAAGGAVEIAIRLALPNRRAAIDLSSKFGVPADEADAVLAAARERAGRGIGLSVHTGSQNADPDSFVAAAEAMAALARRHGRMRSFNLGGGLPVAYLPHESYDLGAYFRAIDRAVSEHLRPWLAPGGSIVLELGRAVVAECAELLIPVLARETRRGRACLYIDDGIFTSFSDAVIHGWRYHIGAAGRGGRRLSPRLAEFLVFGRTCDSGDVLGTVLLPEDVDEGDSLHVPKAGAYMDCQGSDFNGFARPTYVFHGGRR